MDRATTDTMSGTGQRRILPKKQANKEQLPPHAPDAERGIIGAVLVDPTCLTELRQGLVCGPDTPHPLYDLRHQRIWEAICALDDERQPVDLINLVERLRRDGHLESVGGLVYLNEMMDDVPSAANASSYLAQVRDQATLRAMLAQCTRSVARVHDYEGSVTNLVAKYQAEVMALTQQHVRADYVHIKEPMLHLADILEQRRYAKQVITGVETPYWYLNNMTCGLQKREMILVAARPSCGKTALMVDLMLHAAVTGVGCLFISIEMKDVDISLRMLANRSRVNGIKLRNGFWRDDKSPAISEWAERIVKLPIRICDNMRITAQEIYLMARRAKAMHDVGLVLIDYAQIITPASKYNTKNDEMSETSNTLKRLAKELDLPVVVAAQLNRDAEKDRGGKRPLLSDIKDCGAFEQDADVVGLLWEPKVDDDDEDDMKWLHHHEPDDPKDDSRWITQGPEAGWRDEFRRINLSIGKNRNGPTGDCELVFQKASARFVDAHSPRRVKETLL